MSDPEEDEDDMPDDKDSSRSGLGDADVETREDEEEDSSDDFFAAGEGAVISADRLSSRAASESDPSGAGTEGDPMGPVTLSAAAQHDLTATTTQSDSGRRRPFPHDIVALCPPRRRKWVDPMLIPPPTPLEPSPPAFPPPIIAKSKSSSSTKSRKRKENHAHVPFPSSAVEGVSEDRPRRVPQMNIARGWDGGRTQSGGVKGVIAPEPRPAEPDDLDF